VRATRAYLEFLLASIRNPNTRLAYAHALTRFLLWCEERGRALERIDPLTVAAFVEKLTRERAAPTVKQHLAAIRMLFDSLVLKQVVPFNPASSVVLELHGSTPPAGPGSVRQPLPPGDVVSRPQRGKSEPMS